MNLPPRWRKLLLMVHLVATIGWLGADLVLLALGISGVRGSDPQTVYPAARLVGAWLVAPLAVVSLGTGLVQGLLTPWGLLGHWWVAIKFTLTVVMTGLVFFLLVPKLGRAADAATGLTPHPLADAERMQLAVAPTVACTLLVLNVILSVYKPFGRVRSRAKA